MTHQLKRSDLFKRQALEYVQDYKKRADSTIADRFVDNLEQAIRFVVSEPAACAIYTRIGGQEYRRWPLKDFPHCIYFRQEQEKTIVLEAIYAHRQQVDRRLSADIAG